MKSTQQLLTVPKAELNVDTPNRLKYLQNGVPKTFKSNVLGRGTFGTVFKASYKGKDVAVKILEKKDKLNTIKNEANILGWEHENIIKVYKIDLSKNYGFVIMERFRGQCLESILENVHLPLVHRVCISRDIITALNYCHSHKVLHLDVKPQNVMVSFLSQYQKRPYSKYICKLCDFGLSMTMEETEFITSRMQGTVRYMSPEALRSKKITPASDIYSLAVIMWQLREQKVPYFAIEENEIILYKVAKEGLRPDSDESCGKNNFFKSIQHRNCLCDQYSTLSGAGENSNRNCENITNNISKSLSPFRPRHSNIQQNVKPKLSVRKDLNSLMYSQKNPMKVMSKVNVVNITTTSDMPVIDSKIDLQVFFEDNTKFKINLPLAELKYESIYKTCWSHFSIKRFNGPQLENILADILLQLF